MIDPCARQIDGEFKDNPLLHAGHNEPDYRDNASIAPKCVVVVDHYDWEDDAPPRTPWGSTIIYEAHVKGLTYLHPEIPVEIRGTYKALGHPVMINYLKQLGITALEVLPVAQFASEPRLQRMGLSNYWGTTRWRCLRCIRRMPARQKRRWMSFAMQSKHCIKRVSKSFLISCSTIVRNWTSTARYSRCVGSTTVAIIG